MLGGQALHPASVLQGSGGRCAGGAGSREARPGTHQALPPFPTERPTSRGRALGHTEQTRLNSYLMPCSVPFFEGLLKLCVSCENKDTPSPSRAERAVPLVCDILRAGLAAVSAGGAVRQPVRLWAGAQPGAGRPAPGLLFWPEGERENSPSLFRWNPLLVALCFPSAFREENLEEKRKQHSQQLQGRRSRF